MRATFAGRKPSGHSSGERSAVAAVTPWYACSVTIAPRRPVAPVAIRQAMSFASLPELTSITVSRPVPGGIDASRRSASSTSGSYRYRACVLSRRVCRTTASVTRGWQWPTTGTLLYASSSRLPSAS